MLLYACLVDGTCYDLDAGLIDIELRIMDCSGYSVHDGFTGWMNTRQLTVMEIQPRTVDSELELVTARSLLRIG